MDTTPVRLAKRSLASLWKQDTTYKTTKYELALFFVCVRTNVGYSVVGEFIVQSENTENIREAIEVLKKWNPKWKPKYFMTDYLEAELTAIETAFPATKTYLCDFHREQDGAETISMG